MMTITGKYISEAPTSGMQLANTIDKGDLVYVLPIAVTLMLLGLAGNFLVFITILASKRIQLRKQGFVISVNVADLLFFTLVFPFVLSSLANQGWVIGDAWCSFQGYMAVVSCHASIFGIAMIAVNRYFSIVHVSTYRKHFTRHTCFALIGLSWACALALPIPALAGWGRIAFDPVVDSCIYNWTDSPSYTLFILITGFMCPLFIIIFCYISIFVSYMRSRNRIRSWQQQSIANQSVNGNLRVPGDSGVIRSSEERATRESWRLAGQLLAVFVSYVICWTPYILLSTVIDPWTQLDRTYYDIASNLIVLNGVLNPALYFFLNKTLRQEAYWLLCKKCKKGQPRAPPASSASRF